jgi:hypothetical protein
MTIDGQSETAFSAKTLDFVDNATGLYETVIQRSREKYTRPKEQVEREVAEWSGMTISTTISNVGGPSESDEKPAEIEERQINSIEDVFEAPIVRNVSKKGKTRQKEDVAAAIKENVPTTPLAAVEMVQEAPAKKTSIPNSQTVTKEAGETPKSAKVKDKIDKEILAEILKNVVSPAGAVADNKKLNNNIDDTENKNSENREVPKEKTVSPSPAKEKIITAENFKEVKTIHPHERVKLPEDPQDIVEGQQIHFD